MRWSLGSSRNLLGESILTREYTAVIQAGGKGTRMRELTGDRIPKPMLELGGKPMIQWQVENLKKYGIREFVFIIGHLGEKVKDYFGDGTTFGVHISYVEENEPLGSGGALCYLKDITAGDPATVQGVKIVMNFGVDGTTGIVNMESKDAADKEEAWYTVDGRRLSGKPTANGIYIKNGKKMVIK